MRSGNLSSTLKKLYMWEKKLYHEVKVRVFFVDFKKLLQLGLSGNPSPFLLCLMPVHFTLFYDLGM